MIRAKKDKYIYPSMDYKIDKKRKVFKEKYDSDNLLIQKCIIFSYLYHKLKLFKLEMERFVVFIILIVTSDLYYFFNFQN